MKETYLEDLITDTNKKDKLKAKILTEIYNRAKDAINDDNSSGRYFIGIQDSFNNCSRYIEFINKDMCNAVDELILASAVAQEIIIRELLSLYKSKNIDCHEVALKGSFLCVDEKEYHRVNMLTDSGLCKLLDDEVNKIYKIINENK